MKNSIEEDIARIEKIITTKFNNDYSIDNKDKEAIEHVLLDYKNYKKENEKLNSKIPNLEQSTEILMKTNTILTNELNDSIYKKKIKDKIEELNKVYNAEELEDILWRKNYTITELVQYVLQELLEEGDNK